MLVDPMIDRVPLGQVEDGSAVRTDRRVLHDWAKPPGGLGPHPGTPGTGDPAWEGAPDPLVRAGPLGEGSGEGGCHFRGLWYNPLAPVGWRGFETLCSSLRRI